MPKRKAERGRGQIIHRGDEKYLIRYYVGMSPDGSRRYRSQTVRGTYKKAERELTRVLRDIDTGLFVEPSDQTLGEYVDTWLQTIVRLRVSERTFEDYQHRVKRDIVSRIGHRRLDKVTLQDIQGAYAELQSKGLGSRTIRYTHAVLKQALEHAVRTGLLVKNPSQYAALPRTSRKEMAVLTPPQVNRLLEVTKGDEWHALWAVLLLAGLRPGEALGLRWADLDDDRLRIVRALKKVEGDRFVLAEPKTEGSRRNVLLPRPALDALNEHRVRQARHVLRAGARYHRQDLIFANSIGQPMDISKVRRLFKKALKQAGLPDVRLYDSRHTHATLLLSAGENPKVVSERLGHSNIGITLDTYSHVLPHMQV